MMVVRAVTALVVFQSLAMALMTSGEQLCQHRGFGKLKSLTDEEIRHILANDPAKLVAAFVSFKDKYEKAYATKQVVKHRYSVFTANVEYIEEHNKKHSSYKLGINRWADLTPAEFAAAHGMKGHRPEGGEPEHSEPATCPDKTSSIGFWHRCNCQ